MEETVTKEEEEIIQGIQKGKASHLESPEIRP